MKIFLILSTYLIYTLTTESYIFNIDGNGDLKLSSMFSNMKPFQFVVEHHTDMKNSKTTKKNKDVTLTYYGFKDFDLPKFSIRDSTDKPISYSLTIKPCETCLIFDYVSNKTSTDPVQCELYNNEMGYSVIDDFSRSQLDVKKNLPLVMSDFMLTNENKVYVSYRNEKYDEITKYVNDTDFLDESTNIHDMYTYKDNVYFNLVLCGDKHIYIFDVGVSVDKDGNVIPVLKLNGKIKKDGIADISYDDIENFSGNDYPVTNYYIFVNKGIKNGIHTLTKSDVRSSYTVKYVSTVTFGTETVDLNIINVYCLHRNINIAYLLIEGKGLFTYDLNKAEVLAMLTNQYITKMDSAVTFDYTSLGLFINNKEVDEFFVELAINFEYPIDLTISRAYLSKKEFKTINTDAFRLSTYLSTDDSTYLISRNQILTRWYPYIRST
jgi:hypothetical protein